MNRTKHIIDDSISQHRMKSLNKCIRKSRSISYNDVEATNSKRDEGKITALIQSLVFGPTTTKPQTSDNSSEKLLENKHYLTQNTEKRQKTKFKDETGNKNTLETGFLSSGNNINKSFENLNQEIPIIRPCSNASTPSKKAGENELRPPHKSKVLEQFENDTTHKNGFNNYVNNVKLMKYFNRYMTNMQKKTTENLQNISTNESRPHYNFPPKMKRKTPINQSPASFISKSTFSKQNTHKKPMESNPQNQKLRIFKNVLNKDGASTKISKYLQRFATSKNSGKNDDIDESNERISIKDTTSDQVNNTPEDCIAEQSSERLYGKYLLKSLGEYLTNPNADIASIQMYPKNNCKANFGNIDNNYTMPAIKPNMHDSSHYRDHHKQLFSENVNDTEDKKVRIIDHDSHELSSSVDMNSGLANSKLSKQQQQVKTNFFVRKRTMSQVPLNSMKTDCKKSLQIYHTRTSTFTDRLCSLTPILGSFKKNDCTLNSNNNSAVNTFDCVLLKKPQQNYFLKKKFGKGGCCDLRILEKTNGSADVSVSAKNKSG